MTVRIMNDETGYTSTLEATKDEEEATSTITSQDGKNDDDDTCDLTDKSTSDEKDDKRDESAKENSSKSDEAKPCNIDEPTSTEIEKPWPLRDIKEPHQNDVLYGRGGGTNHHPGNKRYRKIVEGRKLDYINSKRLDKPLVALEIIRNWRLQEPPGRFLKQDESTGMWNDVGDKKAREKTSQALREKAPMLKRESEKGRDRTGYGESLSDPENLSRDPHRVVSFSKSSDKPHSRGKLSRAVLLRDHSLGTDYVDSESFSLNGFSWQKPIKELQSRNSGSSTSFRSDLFPLSSEKPTREHSLGLNPLRHTNIVEPVDPAFFNTFSRTGNGVRAFRTDNRGSTRYNNSADTNYRHPRSRKSNSSDYEPEIFQSWSTGHTDEYGPPNPNTSYTTWPKHDSSTLSDDNRPIPPYDRSLPFFQNSTPRASSKKNEFHSEASSSDYRFPNSKTGIPYDELRRRPQSLEGHQSNNNTTYNSTRVQPYDQHHLPQAQSALIYRSSSEDHYLMEKRKSPSNKSNRHDINTYREPYSSDADDLHSPQSYSSNFNAQMPQVMPQMLTQDQGSPKDDLFESVFERDSETNFSRPHHNSSSHPSGRLGRPMMVKRNTSNQNEQAETKKDTKLIKRPGLNRENSLIARKLREEQERKRNSLSPKGGRNYDTTTNDAEDPISINDSDPEVVQLRSSNISVSFQRQHSLAGHKLNDSYLTDGITGNVFSDNSDDDEDLDKDRMLHDDEDILGLSLSTNEIDLGQSSSLEKPSAIKASNRVSTIEYIENAFIEEKLSKSFLDELEP